ncbi:MAG TPA: cytochrome d ubiquinol oxidase subunit II [Elusimicrobia bacterium]|nr:cytochrome d ubiquinol oxidase subunit II [Elusimicrobiota bacterium]HBT62355.1 cytochrome d ubiquinol oxidase subunit II [Elusimicrobiota bacterium]
MDLNTLWFILLGALLAGYAVLDGFDLGVGILHPFWRAEEEKLSAMAAIAPFWDGNEVWLITFGAALFAAFPHAYATAFSAFYLPFILLLFCLMARAMALEFRAQSESAAWRGFWDRCFFAGSAGASFLFGVAAGNLVMGLAVGADMEFAGALWGLLKPYPLLVGCFAVALFALHGGLYLCVKAGGRLQERARFCSWRALEAFCALFVSLGLISIVHVPAAPEGLGRCLWTWSALAGALAAIGGMAMALRARAFFRAWLCGAVVVAACVALLAAMLYPCLVRSSLDPAWSLTIYNAASSRKTLAIMRNIALLGMPWVVFYTAFIYRVFRGRLEAAY